MASTLYAHDSRYGTFTLTYEGGSEGFVGCKSVSFPGDSLCDAASTPVEHQLTSSGSSLTLTTNFVLAGGGYQCPPDGLACSVANFNALLVWSNVSSDCGPPFSASFNLPTVTSGSNAYRIGYRSGDTLTISTS